MFVSPFNAINADFDLSVEGNLLSVDMMNDSKVSKQDDGNFMHFGL